VSDAPPQNVHALMAPSQHTSMQSMNSMEVDLPISANMPVIRIIIPEPEAQ
jgi:hypothetical protein